MAIVLPRGRPAIDIVKGSYERPEEPWAHLGNPAPRTQLEAAISAVGRVDYIGHPSFSWGGTAFVVGPNLLMTSSLGPLLRADAEGYTFNDGQLAWVDFRHERYLAESLRFKIEKVIYVDPRWKVEMVSATLPDTITPLALSHLTPDETRGSRGGAHRLSLVNRWKQRCVFDMAAFSGSIRHQTAASRSGHWATQVRTGRSQLACSRLYQHGRLRWRTTRGYQYRSSGRHPLCWQIPSQATTCTYRRLGDRCGPSARFPWGVGTKGYPSCDR
jgi:hypothetical protein